MAYQDDESENDKLDDIIREYRDEAGEIETIPGQIPDTSVNINDIVESRIEVVIGDKIINYFTRLGIKASRVYSSEITKIRQVYHPPSFYSQTLDNLKHHEWVVLVGPPHFGKKATALSLALDLRDNDNELEIMPLRFSESASLIDFLTEDECPNHTIFIINDAFAVPGLSYREIERYPDQISYALIEKRNYAILSTDYDPVFENLIPVTNIIKIDTDIDITLLQNALEKHITYYQIIPEVQKLIKKLSKESIKSLSSFPNIDRFAYKVSLLNNVQDIHTLDLLIKDTTNVNEETKKWFDSLDPNQIYFAMLISLCPDLEKDKLWDLYTRIIKTLHKEGVKLASPLNYSQENLQTATKTFETEIGSLNFANPYDAIYTQKQVAHSYRQQFLYILPIFSSFVLTHKGKSQESRDARISIATAIGEFGKSSYKQVFRVLTQWAEHEDSTIRSSAAHSLRATAQSDRIHYYIKVLISEWINSPNQRLRWTAAATLERLYYYPKLEEYVIQELKKLAADSSEFVRRAVRHALNNFSKSDFEEVFSILNDWVDSDNANRKRTAALAFVEIVNQGRRGRGREYISDPEKLLTSMNIFGELILDRNSLDYVFQALQPWIELSEPSISANFKVLLLEKYSVASNELKELIIERLNYWRKLDKDNLHYYAVILLDDISVFQSGNVLVLETRPTTNLPDQIEEDNSEITVINKHKRQPRTDEHAEEDNQGLVKVLRKRNITN
jgi:3-methyladenine DNA glycosylase AlkC